MRGAWPADRRDRTSTPSRTLRTGANTFPLTLPEFAGFDAVLVLDNDILINANSPSITDGWDPDKVAIADEREQFAWVTTLSRGIIPTTMTCGRIALKHPRVLNTGVLLYTRAHVPLFA